MDKVICFKCEKEFNLNINDCPSCCKYKREMEGNSKEAKHIHPLACSDCRKVYPIIRCYHLH